MKTNNPQLKEILEKIQSQNKEKKDNSNYQKSLSLLGIKHFFRGEIK